MLSIQKHKYSGLYSAILGLGLLLGAPAHASIEADGSSAVVFVYQRVGEDSMPTSSISVEKFREHIRELTTGGYRVLPLGDLVDAVKNGADLPHKTVALTFDGAYSSTLANAVPLLEEAKLPFTVFFASDMVDGGAPSRMTWAQLRDLRKSKRVTLGILPSSYAHMAGLAPEASAGIVNKALARYKEEFGEDPQFFAWPYGEYSAALKKQLGGYAFKAAFGEHSGVVHAKADFLSLPRFIMTDNYGDLDRFRLTANALPLPVSDIIPDDMAVRDNPPLIGFTITPELPDLSRLSCFASGIGKLDILKPGGGRVEIRLKEPLDDRRTRINCTLPDDTVIPGEPPSWRWFGLTLIAPDHPDGDAEGDDAGGGEEENGGIGDE